MVLLRGSFLRFSTWKQVIPSGREWGYPPGCIPTGEPAPSSAAGIDFVTRRETTETRFSVILATAFTSFCGSFSFGEEFESHEHSETISSGWGF